MMMTAGAVLLSCVLVMLVIDDRRARRRAGNVGQALAHRIHHDCLTGLANREHAIDLIAHLQAGGSRSTTCAVLTFDLDNFSEINDTFGHDIGDQILWTFTQRLRATVGDIGLLARTGGDEFMLVVEDAALDRAPELIAERILIVARRPFMVVIDERRVPIHVSTSIGIAVGARSELLTFVRDAEIALFRAKGNGRDRYCFFHPMLHAALARRALIEADLRLAIERDQLTLMYQPIYDIDDLSIVAVEALVRWWHPTLGQVTPSEFVPMLEQSGQIVEVGRWILRRACTQAAAWQQTGTKLRVAVNASARQLDDPRFVTDVQSILTESGLDPTCLAIELTETSVVRDPLTAHRALSELRALGIETALDDFGTGYASLSCLRDFDLRVLKIDRSFVQGIDASEEAEALVRHLISLAADLGLRTVAEGVESVGQLDRLRTAGANYVQGHLLARPMTVDMIESQILCLSPETWSRRH